MTDFAVVCDGNHGNHPQALLTTLRGGTLEPGRRARRNERGQVVLTCGVCRSCAKFSEESAVALAKFFTDNPSLAVKRVVPERFEESTQAEVDYPAIRLHTMILVLKKMAHQRRSSTR